MLWIVSAKSEITGNHKQLMARLQFIHAMTGASASWEKIVLNNGLCPYYFCTTDDRVDGVFITAHNNEVEYLCSQKCIADREFVVANTCIWDKGFDRKVLHKMIAINQNAQLWFAKQNTEIINGIEVHYSNYIEDVGTFGFLTSKSERILYKSRRKGILEAIRNSFVLVEI